MRLLKLLATGFAADKGKLVFAPLLISRLDDVLDQIQRLVRAAGPTFSQSDRCNFAIACYTFSTYSYILRAYALAGNCDKHQFDRQNSTVGKE
jgi:hypothetical protein